MCILRPDFDEEALEAAINRVADMVAAAGGAVDKVERWGKRHLAYPIAGRTEGFYTVTTFTGTGAISNELTRRLNISEDVVRSIIVRRDLKPVPSAAPEAAPQGEPEAVADAEA
jgi:small subunit ribosomal protein S6